MDADLSYYEYSAEDRQTTSERLSLMADAIIGLSYLTPYGIHTNGFNTYIYDENGPAVLKTMLDQAKAWKRPNAIEKEYTDEFLSVILRYNHGMTITLRAARSNVCEKRVVGTREVERIDYENAPKKMVTEDIVEWDCHPILADI